MANKPKGKVIVVLKIKPYPRWSECKNPIVFGKQKSLNKWMKTEGLEYSTWEIEGEKVTSDFFITRKETGEEWEITDTIIW